MGDLPGRRRDHIPWDVLRAQVRDRIPLPHDDLSAGPVDIEGKKRELVQGLHHLVLHGADGDFRPIGPHGHPAQPKLP